MAGSGERGIDGCLSVASTISSSSILYYVAKDFYKFLKDCESRSRKVDLGLYSNSKFSLIFYTKWKVCHEKCVFS